MRLESARRAVGRAVRLYLLRRSQSPRSGCPPWHPPPAPASTSPDCASVHLPARSAPGPARTAAARASSPGADFPPSVRRCARNEGVVCPADRLSSKGAGQTATRRKSTRRRSLALDRYRRPTAWIRRDQALAYPLPGAAATAASGGNKITSFDWVMG